jgi:tetratricopeptide (TPR) repeat protein
VVKDQRKPTAPAPAAGDLDGPEAGRRRAASQRAFLAIALTALIVRALYLSQASSAPLFERLIVDGASYDAWARRIAAGEWIGGEVFYQAPLYPYFLALLKFVFGDGLWPIRIVQILLGSLSCGLLFLGGQSFFSRRVGLLAGFTLAFYPPAIFFDGLIQKAALGGVLTTALLALLGRARHAMTARQWLACGVVLGALMATREETLLLAPVLLIVCAIGSGKSTTSSRTDRVLSFLGGIALVLAPIAARNAYVGGGFVLTTSQAGPNFYIGNHAGASGVYEPLRAARSDTPFEREDARELAELGAGRKLSPSEVSNYWFKQSFEWIASHPGDWLALLARKLALALNAYEVPDYEGQAYYAEHSGLLRALGWVLHFGVVFPLAVAGAYLSWPRRKELRMLHVVFVTLVAGCVLFYVFGRYRYPLAPLAILFASAAVFLAHEHWLGRNTRKLAIAGVLALAAAVGSNVSLVDAKAQLAMSYSNAGAALLDAGRHVDAAKQLRRSVELDDDADTRANLSAALLAGGEASEALVHARRAVELRADDPLLVQRLGQAQYASGDERGAIETLKSSIQAWPANPESWAALVQIFVAREDWLRALETARNAVRYNPDDVATSLSLAFLLATAADVGQRNPSEAVQIAQRLESVTNGADPRVLDVLGVALASAGRKSEAQEKFEQAARAADAAGQTELAERIRASAAALQSPILR